MSRKISDRSREFCRQALQTLRRIRDKYCVRPNAEEMKDADRSWLTQEMMHFGNAVAATRYRGFSFYDDAVKNIRNGAAHAVREDIREFGGRVRNFFSWADRAESEIRANIARAYSQNKKIRLFEKFSAAFGEEERRKLFVDSLQNQYFGSDGKERPENSEQLDVTRAGRTETEKKLAEAAASVLRPTDLSQKELLGFARSQDGLSDSVLEEIVSWADSVQQKLTEENPFAEEECFVQKLEADLPGKTNAAEYGKIKTAYLKCPSVKNFKPNVNLDFYEKEFSENEKKLETKVVLDQLHQDFAELSENEKKLENKDKDGTVKKSAQTEFEERNKILFRNLLKDMKKELLQRKTAWELERIEEERKEFLKKLYEKIEKFRKLMELLKSFTKNFGRLWDLARGEFEDSGFEILEQYADLLKEDAGLQELAEMIGRHYEEEQKYRKELRAKVVIETVFNPEPAYKGEIAGLRLSDSISDALPSELALYAGEKTRPIFKMKFARKQLLSYAYTRDMEYQMTHEETEEVDVGEPEERKGPMIICVDTSGSMQGTPERVAKTVAFALAQKSLEEERGCYLVSFSTGIETMDLTSFDSADGLKNLAKFLRMSFYGGTDLTPALEQSLKMLSEKEWKNADVLMISDFVADGLGDELLNEIKAQKENKTRFFSLAVTSGGNDSVISVFNRNWIYDTDTSARDAGAKLVRQLYEMHETSIADSVANVDN